MNNYEVKSKEWFLRNTSNLIQKPFPNEAASQYNVEILSVCDLKCCMCGFGSKEIFQRKNQLMDIDTFTKIIKKIQKESPHATISPFCQCEPSLHPQFTEMVKIIKDHNFSCVVSLNFNTITKIKELVEANPDLIEISVSGFYQETYAKNHIGGDIEKVKNKLITLHNIIKETESTSKVAITYHMYKDNIGEDYDKMKEFCEQYDFVFSPYWSRSINLELSLKWLREKGYSSYTGETEKWFDELPPLTDVYKNGLDRMIHHPEDYLEGKWKNIRCNECLSNNHVVNIRCNGKMPLCNFGFDDRLDTEYDYLTTSLEKLWEARSKSLICRECLANNYVLHTNYIDIASMDDIAKKRLDSSIIGDRRLFGDDSDCHNMDDIIEFSHNHDKVFIFGSGLYGQKMARMFKENDITFDGFVISDGREKINPDIKYLSEITAENYSNAGIIVALDVGNRKQVREILDNCKYDVIYAKQAVFMNHI